MTEYTWLQEVFFLRAAEILSGNAGPYKDLAETGNRTRKVSGTLGRQTVINLLQETCKELKDGTSRFLNRVKSCDNTNCNYENLNCLANLEITKLLTMFCFQKEAC